MTHESGIRVEKHAHVARVILDRPERLNAFNSPMLAALEQAIGDVAADTDIRCLLMIGAGRAFSAGQDLSERDPRKYPEGFDLEAIQLASYQPIIRSIVRMQKPVIAAVNGLAAGAGAALALSADLMMMAQSAKLMFSFSKVGLSVDAGGGWFLARQIGPARARGLMMTGGQITAEDASQLGLAYRVVPDEALDTEASDLAQTLANGPTVALNCIKQAIALTGEDFESYLGAEARLQGIAGQSADYREGVLAFLERRPALFKGQ